MQNHPNQDQSAGEENRRDSASPERRSKLEGFDTKKNRPGSTARSGRGAAGRSGAGRRNGEARRGAQGAQAIHPAP